MASKATPKNPHAKAVSKDKLVVPENWTFKNASVAENFDIHVREQLPWYDLATGIVQHLGRHYLSKGGRMYDIGSSTGSVTKILADVIDSRSIEAISIDNSEEMAKVWSGKGQLVLADVGDYKFKEYDFGVCFLVLMFLPPSVAAEVVSHLYEKLKPGGALVICDKVAQYQGYLAVAMHRLALAQKVKSGVPYKAIIDKELSLIGAQRPIDVDKVFAGLPKPSEVFRFGEFVGWVLTK